MSVVVPEGTEHKYEPYPEYGDSGIEWLGNIPAYWNIQRLKFSSFIKGRIGWQNLRSEEFIEEGPYLITGMHFINNSIDWDSCYHVSEERYNVAPEIWVQEHDLLTTKDGTIGKIAYVDSLPDKATLNSHLLLIRSSRKQYIQKYLFYLLISDIFRQYALNRQFGTTFNAVTQNDIENFDLIIPSLTEQQIITDFLDRKTASIDELIAKKQRLIELLQEQRTALIKHTVTKGLNLNAPKKDSEVEWLGEIPAHWGVKKLKWTITSCSNGIWGDEETGENDIVCIRVADFDRMRLKAVGDNLTWRSIPSNMLSRRKLQKGDLLLEKSGGGEHQPVGAVVIYELDYEAVCSNFVACMKIADGHNPRFLNYSHYVLYSSRVNIRSIKQTTGIQNLDSYYYLNELIPVPDMNEQQVIVDYLDMETSKIDALVSKIKRAIEKYQEYRSALITAAVIGQIDVRQYVS